MAGRRIEAWLGLLLTGCVAEAAELEQTANLGQTEQVERTEQTERLERADQTERLERLEQTEQTELAMSELALGDQSLEPARERVPAFLPDWDPPSPDAGPLPRWIEHQTIPRETIEALALRYGVSPRSLRDWNHLGVDEQPHPRLPKPLRVWAQRNPPPRVAIEHHIVEGDGWGSIARRYGVDPTRLRAWNVGEIGRTLEVGESLVIWADPTVLDAIVRDRPDSPRAALVRPGAHGVGTAQAGILVAGVQLPPGPGYTLRYPNSAWGTTFAVREAIAALDRFVRRTAWGRPLMVGTMSRQRGGAISGHNSHQTGRDLDIRLPLRPELPHGLEPTLRRIDWVRTWALVSAFAEADSVEVIFLDYGAQRRLHAAAQTLGIATEELKSTLQYPRGSQANQGLVQHSPGHEGHIHVRFRCGLAEPECG